jgi:Raf kinase inhibitor-like YbhB/YbcL family protein
VGEECQRDHAGGGGTRGPRWYHPTHVKLRFWTSPSFIATTFNLREEIMHRMLLGTAIAVFGAINVCTAFAQDMTLTSTEVADGSTIKEAQVANVFGCKGGNISPSLSWSGAPSDTKSFAITVYDPDAPTGSGFWHWVVFNIPASTTSVPLNAGDVKKKLMPKGAIQSRTDFGTDGYGGPCPPQGDKPHHYTFTVYAVDEDKLQFAKDHNVSAAVVGFELHFHAKAKGVLTATYGR